MVNGIVEKRNGLITREKNTTIGLKQSVIDFVIVSNDLIEHVLAIHVDEKRIHVLTKNVKNKKGPECIQSDHNIIQTMLRLRWSPKECKSIEVFKFNDKVAKEKFKKLTSNTKQLSSIVDKDKPLDIVTKQLLKRINGFVHECFAKVKIIDKPNKDLERLYNKRTVFRTKADIESKKQLENVESELCNKYSEVMFKNIMNEVKGIEDSEDGGFNAGRLWKLKKKLSPKASDPPTAMLNSDGKLITSDDDIKAEAVKHYKNVFKEREIIEDLKDFKVTRENLCHKRLQKASRNKSQEWSITDVTSVLKCLKTGKSKDPYQLPNELFRPSVAGDDLILAVTKLMNRIKIPHTGDTNSLDRCG